MRLFPGRRTAGIPAPVWILGLVSLLMDVSSEMVQSLMPLYLAGTLGASALAIGAIEGLAVAVATATKYIAGLLSDHGPGPKKLAVLGYGLAALSRLLLPMAASVDTVVIARAVDRVGKGIRGAPRDAIIAAVTPPGIRGASFGLRKSLDTVGGFAGPLLAVAAMAALAGNIRGVFWLAVIPAALAVLLLALRVPETARPEAKTPFRLAEALRLNRAVWGVIALASLLMLARFSEAFVLLKALDAGMAATWVPLALVLMHAVYGLAAYPVGKRSDRTGVRGLLILSLGFLMAAHVVLALSGSVWAFLLGTVFWGLHMGFSQGLLGAMIAGATPPALKGSAFGTFNLVTGGVLLLGNVAAGALWSGFGPAAPFWAGAVLSLAALLWLLSQRSSAPSR
ncbi:MFS transporter [Pseudooceanicola sp. CBS1P-1]|uniref:MFS transporter n=1 Tax=Pseudooceanicola albus TaxID=2692189 RepID=A0A6L7G7I5_9RHOB|nr:MULTISPECIES: MFS transporter [Pseudooceanicola]MBT9385753.1 MFS transporter [Pseudooceanicola endophyticus]MXN19985.1 MFS transporter [Pseudooceanicola albus]